MDLDTTAQFCYIGSRIGWVSALLYYHIISHHHRASYRLTRLVNHHRGSFLQAQDTQKKRKKSCCKKIITTGQVKVTGLNGRNETRAKRLIYSTVTTRTWQTCVRRKYSFSSFVEVPLMVMAPKSTSPFSSTMILL